MNTILAGIISLFLIQAPAGAAVSGSVVSQAGYSLENRYDNSYVNQVFADNILLTLAYLRGVVRPGESVSWEAVRAPFVYTFTLHPGETFAFHDQLLPQFEGKVVRTTNAHFNGAEGFRSDGWLVGDGVCHLASFLNVVARQAGLQVLAPTRHDFAKIADVPRELGVSINSAKNSRQQNLYITNNRAVDVAFTFTYQSNLLSLSVEKAHSSFTLDGDGLTL